MDLSKKIVVRELKYVGFYAIIYITFIAVYLVVINQFGMEISIYAKYVRDEILFVSWILLFPVRYLILFLKGVIKKS